MSMCISKAHMYQILLFQVAVNGVSAIGVPFAKLTTMLTAHKGYLDYTHLRLIKETVKI